MIPGPRRRGRRGRSLGRAPGTATPLPLLPFPSTHWPLSQSVPVPAVQVAPPPPSAAAVLPVLSDAPPRRPHRQGPAWSRVPPVADCRTLLTRSDGLICTPATTSSPATDGPPCPRSSGSPRLPTPGRQPCSPLHPGHASNRTAFSRPLPETSRSARAQLSRMVRASRHRAPPPPLPPSPPVGACPPARRTPAAPSEPSDLCTNQAQQFVCTAAARQGTRMGVWAEVHMKVKGSRRNATTPAHAVAVGAPAPLRRPGPIPAAELAA